MSIATTAETLRQLLQECPDTVVSNLWGCSWSAVQTMRKHQDLPSRWTGQPQMTQKTACRVLRERWKGYPDQVPDPITSAELDALVSAELHQPVIVTERKSARRKPGGPPNPLHVLAEAQQQIAAGKAPTDQDIAQAGGWTETQVYNTLLTVRGTVLRDPETGTYRTGMKRQRMDPAVVALMDTYRTRTILHNGPYREQEATR